MLHCISRSASSAWHALVQPIVGVGNVIVTAERKLWTKYRVRLDLGVQTVTFDALHGAAAG